MVFSRSLQYLFLEDFGYLTGMTLWLAALAVGLWALIRYRRFAHGVPSRLRRANLLLSFWMGGAALTAVELYFALLYDTTDSFNRTKVSRKWYRIHADRERRPLEIRPGEGIYYRDDHDFPKQPPEGRYRICFLGDSFTFGHGIANIQDRFSNRIQAALDRQAPGRFEVTNLSDAGTDLYWVEGLLKELFENGFRIDTAVYVLCLNDIETFHPRHRTYYENFDERVGQPHFFLFRHSYFFNLMFYRWRYLIVPELRDYYSFVHDYYEGEPWQLMKQKLLEVNELCRRHEADFRVVVFPFLHNLGPEYPFRHAHQLIDGFCRQSGIPVLDLEPVLTPHVREGLMVSRFDAHPNERAQALVADAILRDLLADLISRAKSPDGLKPTNPRPLGHGTNPPDRTAIPGSPRRRSN
ncbi:MAG: SGNH/GDSL hydrolase family protein [Planctomycetes bacterium]|nr:SGNH/GDSL hydrolase family protein [Planctomycetota bacterium]